MARFTLPRDLYHGKGSLEMLKTLGGTKAEKSIIDEQEFLAKLPEIASNAIGDACTGSNPRQPSQEEMEKLLLACYYDNEIDF